VSTYNQSANQSVGQESVGQPVASADLEGRLLEVNVARGAREHEAEVDVDEVALGVQQDVPVVPVLDLCVVVLTSATKVKEDVVDIA
jgi:hypothetical protein